MCGISIKKKASRDRISHRGIEARTIRKGPYFVRFNSLPLSSNETGLKQPLEEKNTALVFNGEIFNYKELDRYAKSDVDYLNNLLKKGGANRVIKESPKWDGFWAICFITSDDVTFFTDPMGKKQLYFSKGGIASEIKEIYNNESLLPYTPDKYGTSKTPFEDIYRAIPGAIYKLEKGNTIPYKIGNTEEPKPTGKIQDLYKVIDLAVKRRLENRLDGVSLLISGGLDSNIVLHHAYKYCKDIELVTADNGELEQVKKIAELYDLPLKVIPDTFTMEDIKKAVYHYEHPLDYGSLVLNYKLFEACSNHLVLTGDGSDELFRGYQRSHGNVNWFKTDAQLELPYYHNIRLDRMSMAHIKEARSPLMSNDLYSLVRNNISKIKPNKEDLRIAYKGILPDFIIDSEKRPLRHRNDKGYNLNLINSKFKEVWNQQK